MPTPGRIFSPRADLVLDGTVLQRWEGWWKPFWSALVQDHEPAGGSVDGDALGPFVRELSFLTMKMPRELLGLNFSDAVDELFRAQMASTETEKKLSLKHLSFAFETMLEISNHANRFLPWDQITEGEFEDLLDEDWRELAMAHPLREVLQLELSAFVAYELLPESTPEAFATWAKLALTESRRAKAWMPELARFFESLASARVRRIALEDLLRTHLADVPENPAGEHAVVKMMESWGA